MDKIKDKLKSVRIRLFLTLCIVTAIIIMFLIIINNVVLESFYLYSKIQNVQHAHIRINELYNDRSIDKETLEEEITKICIKNDFDILIRNNNSSYLYSSDKELYNAINKINDMIYNKNIGVSNIIVSNENVKIVKIVDQRSSMNYIFLTATLDNGYLLYIRIPIASIQESVRISNNLLILIGGFTILIAGIFASIISKKFTEPILELNDIAKNMSKLDFSKKYKIKDTDDEINNLGKSINIMSDKLETTINQLRDTNFELEKDIEEKSQIDEMRKQFISDVSHELKTPIALIQGYAEGLIENVNTDDESRKFYAEVILDESNKMDKLVKQLLELMKLEYGKREFDNKEFDIVELINEVIRKCNVMIEERKVEVEFQVKEPLYVTADEFYIDQVVTNYFTNAIKHAQEVDGKKQIKITIAEINNKVRISIFNTGSNISEENMERIWKRFYKIDSSRNREDGGTGIGLALVKAIMNNYENSFGVANKEDGVEFYFELNK